MKTKLKIPKIRFKEFSGEWEKKQFSFIYDFVGSNSYSRDCLNYEKGDIKNIHYGDIHTKFKTNFKLKNEKVPFINNNIDLSKITDDKFCKQGDLVIADASEDYKDIGKTIELIDLDNQKVLAGLHTFIARPKKNKVALGFGGYLLKTFNIRLQIMTYATGVKVLGISKTNLGIVNLNLPSFTEQQKIASFLSSVDEKIENIKEKKKSLEEYKKGVMQKIFSQEIRFKDENGEEFGEWEEKKLGEIIDYKNGGSFEEYVVKNGQYNLITLNSIDINGKIKKEHKKVDITDNSLEKGDLIMVLSDVAHGYFLGLTDIVPDDNFVLNQRMGALKPKTDLNRFFLKTLINYNQKYFKLCGQGSSQKNLSKGDILNFSFLFPTLKEQENIADFLFGIDEKLEKVSEELEKMEEFKKGLLQGIFV